MPEITLSEYRVADFTDRSEARQVGLRAILSLTGTHDDGGAVSCNAWFFGMPTDDMRAGNVGRFRVHSDGRRTGSLYLPFSDFRAVYAILRTERPVTLTYRATRSGEIESLRQSAFVTDVELVGEIENLVS